MKISSIYITLLFLSGNVYSQLNKRFHLQANYGLNGNFFVRSYDETGGPDNKKYFYKKSFIGTIAGAELSYTIGRKSSLSIGYNRSTNVGKKNYAGTINGTSVFVNDFKLRHINNFYQLGYGRYLGSSSTGFIKSDVGLFLLCDAKQTISIENWDNSIAMNESNFKNDNSMEGGVYLGLEFSKKIDTKFNLGIRTRVYYLASTNSVEAISFTPVLSCSF